MLRVNALTAGYGNIKVLKELHFSVNEGEVVTIIGANGAGKTTTLKALTGMIRATGGEIEFLGRRIEKMSPHDIVKLGISMVPEGRQIFPMVTVEKNLRIGAYIHRYTDGEMRKKIGEVFELFPRLKERQGQMGGTLSGGEQQMLAIGRAMMASAKLLLLDEPSMGLAPMVVKEIFGVIDEISARGATVLLIEQNARQALKIAHRGYVMETGNIVMEGLTRDLAENDLVRRSYLGVS